MVSVTEGVSPMAESGAAAEEPLHVLWINAGLSCDGDSVALTAATQPSIEEFVLGALQGLPKVQVHWPLIDFECGPEQGADLVVKCILGVFYGNAVVERDDVKHQATKVDGHAAWLIESKTVRLIDRELPQYNLTFIV
jgi:hypothetical protein